MQYIYLKCLASGACIQLFISGSKELKTFWLIDKKNYFAKILLRLYLALLIGSSPRKKVLMKNYTSKSTKKRRRENFLHFCCRQFFFNNKTFAAEQSSVKMTQVQRNIEALTILRRFKMNIIGWLMIRMIRLMNVSVCCCSISKRKLLMKLIQCEYL